MSVSLKNFSDLKEWGQNLKQQQAAREREQAERAKQEKLAQLEANIFRASVGTVAALKITDKHLPAPARPSTKPVQRSTEVRAVLQESLSDEFDADSLLENADNLSYTRPGVGIDVAQKLRNGHWPVQAQLDLHGLRRDQARDALGEFLRQCARNRSRCVRIIHGKGLGSARQEPVLKNKVRNWLIQKDQVLAFNQASAADGGAGALIVLLQA